MKFFTKQSSKAVAKKFAFLFLTMLAFGFTANAQIPTFNEILERYYNPQDLVVKATAQTPPYGQQFSNYTFEEWETVSGSSVEPKNWNSFKTADTKNFLISMGIKDQLKKSEEKRPGAAGSYSARVFSTSTMSIIANGNMTTGKIYAGSTTANNDGNYNFTKRSDASFNNPFTTIPDSLTVWVAFKPKNASKGNARITTTIHGDTDLKQLAKSGDSPADMVCATANQEIAATSTSAVVWKRVTIPFTKGSHNDPRYILATFNTNATPGGGSADDELYVDDICLIYNPTLNMELLAQTEYDVTNINSANISVPFTLDGSMSVYNINKSDNEVIAQLSDANGSFANPIELGRVTTNVSGTINGAIPAGTPAGTGYKVRVVSTNYPMVSNETNITINFTYIPVPEVTIALGDVLAKSAVAAFTPNVDCANYYFVIAPATQSVDAAYVKANGQAKSGSFTATFENLTSDTEYKVYALPLTSDGVEGEMASATLKTVALVPQITLAQGEVATKSATATFTPNADCVKYYYLIALATETVDAAYVKANGQEKSGEFTATFENLISNTNYRVYALPIDVENKAGELKSLAIKTQAFVPQIDLVRNDYAAKSITATFTPNADCVEYYFLISTEAVDAAYIKEDGEVKTEAFTTTFENLTSNTAYTIYALPVDIDGFNGEIKTISVTTKALVPHVAIAQGEVATKSAAATFTPNADCVEYYFLIAKATETVDAAYVKENGVAKTETFATTFEDLISNTDYVIYALPIDVEGTAGALATLAVKTQAFTPQVDVERGNVAAKSITATFTPNADCTEYYFMIAEDDVVDASIIKANGEKQTSTFTKTFENLTSSTAYTIYALPVDVDGFYGEIKSVTITTNALVPQVVITKDEALTYSMTASFTPNSDCVEYYFLIAESTETVDAEYVKEHGELKEGNSANTWENLLPSTNYTIYALPIDIEGKEGDLNTLVVKTRAEAGVSEIDIEIEKLSYTSVTITATPNENTILYHYIVIEKDEADAMGEDALMQRLNENENYIDSIVDTYSMTVESNVAYYVVAQGKNRDDKWGVVTKEKFTVAGPAAVETAVEKVTETTVTVTATPNENAVSYEYIVIEKEEADAMDEAALMQKLAEANDLNGIDVWTYTVKSKVEYYVIAQAKNADGITGEMTKVEFIVAGPATVAVAVEKLNETTVSVAATPNENAVCYSYNIIAKAEADAMTESELKQIISESENKFETANTKEYTVESNVTYYVIAQAVNADDMSGEMTKVEFTVAGSAAVEIAVEKVTETTVTVTATPNANAVSYHYIVIEKAEADAMDADALVQKLEEANELNSVDVWTYTVKSNVEYYVIAQAKNADGRTSEMTKVEFIVAGPATVEIAVEETSETSVAITATPNENAVAYHYIVITKAEADAMDDAALMQKLNENEDYLEGVNTTEVTIESNVAYYVVAKAKNADGKFGVVTKVEFMVEVAGPATVAIEVKETSKTTVTVTATPNENAVAYHYILIEKAEAEEIGEDAVMQRLNENETYLNGVDVCDWTIKSNVEYYVVAQAKNADDKWGEVTKVEFMVKEAGPATVAIAVEEVSKTSVAITATPNENAVAYHYIVITKAEADAMDADALMQKLNENEDYLEGVNTTEVTVESNVEYYVVAQAKNEDGVWGEVTKVEFVVINTESVTELGEVMFEIYPNPAVEYVRITSNAEIENLVVFSIDGKVVYTETVNQEETMIDVTSFAKGSYIVRMVSNDKIFVRRIVVE